MRKSGDGLFAVADEYDGEYFDPIPVLEDDIIEFQISVPRLVDLIRKRNAIDGVCEVSDETFTTLGQKQLDDYGATEVYLSVANHDRDEFAKRCLSLRAPSGVKKIVVLVPCAIPLAAAQRQLLDARGIVLVPLSPLADRGALDIDWDAQVIGPLEDRTADGIYPPETIVFQRKEYRCDLTHREMAFMAIAVRQEETSLGSLINRGEGALWKETFNNNSATRDKVTQFLSRLNRKLANSKPQFAFFLSLPRGRTTIIRTTASNSA